MRLRATRQFTSTIFGTVSEGDVFETNDGYAAHLAEHGLAVPLEDAPAETPVPPTDVPAPVAAAPSLEDALADLAAAAASATPTLDAAATRRAPGRPRR